MTYNDFGTMTIRTYTAGGALPVKNSTVKITGGDEENSSLEYTLLTDINGITERILLPAPSVNFSLSPNPGEMPYALYNVEVTADGYYTKKINNIALFSGTDSFQSVNMIPVSIYESGVDFPKGTLNSIVKEKVHIKCSFLF